MPSIHLGIGVTMESKKNAVPPSDGSTMKWNHEKCCHRKDTPWKHLAGGAHVFRELKLSRQRKYGWWGEGGIMKKWGFSKSSPVSVAENEIQESRLPGQSDPPKWPSFWNRDSWGAQTIDANCRKQGLSQADYPPCLFPYSSAFSLSQHTSGGRTWTAWRKLLNPHLL